MASVSSDIPFTNVVFKDNFKDQSLDEVKSNMKKIKIIGTVAGVVAIIAIPVFAALAITGVIASLPVTVTVIVAAGITAVIGGLFWVAAKKGEHDVELAKDFQKLVGQTLRGANPDEAKFGQFTATTLNNGNIKCEYTDRFWGITYALMAERNPRSTS